MQKIYCLHEIQYFIQSPAITDDWFLVQKALQQMHLTLLLALRPMKIFQTPFKTVKNNSQGGGNPRRGTRQVYVVKEAVMKEVFEGCEQESWRNLELRNSEKSFLGMLMEVQPHLSHITVYQTWTMAPYLTHGVRFILLQMFVI